MFFTILLGLCVPLMQTLAQTQPDPIEILKEVTETYKNVAQYELESTTTFRNADTGQETSGSMRFVYRSPDKYTEEMKGSPLAALAALIGQRSDSVIDEIVTVYDGSNLWAFNPKANEYRVYAVPNLPRDSRPEDADLYMGIGSYRHASQVFGNSKFVREDRVDAGGGPADCYVLETASTQQLLWVDKKSHHVLRVDSSAPEIGSVSMVFKTVRLDEPLSDDTFKFKPPPNARKLN
jgi:outer membrane lipoprotein-sorting protein